MEEKYLNEFKPISLENAKLIASGATGECYRIAPDQVVKLYYEDFPTEMIKEEKYNSRLALVSGINTAISYEMVRYKNRQGVVYELIDARTVSEIIRSDPKCIGEMGTKMGSLAKSIHSSVGETSKLKPASSIIRYGLDKNSIFPDFVIKGAYDSLNELDKQNSFVHGDYNVNNVMIMENEPVLIDMGDFSRGCPMFDLATLYFSLFESPEALRPGVNAFTGLTPEQHRELWDNITREYFDTDNFDVATSQSEEAKLIKKIALLKEIWFVILYGYRYPDEYTELIKKKALAEYGA